jgi:hypothetical protein
MRKFAIGNILPSCSNGVMDPVKDDRTDRMIVEEMAGGHEAIEGVPNPLLKEE